MLEKIKLKTKKRLSLEYLVKYFLFYLGARIHFENLNKTVS